MTPITRSRSVGLLGLRAALLVLAVLALGGRALAHPGGGDSSGAGHLIVEGIGYLVAAFLAYLVLAFARRVVYPKVRGYL